ncbi:hypothetical protein AYM39_09865 [Methylomonas sp. DH-1]|nr:hypothetical protein AYM39_09865 [Methylomonas sp. DH-1]
MKNPPALRGIFIETLNKSVFDIPRRRSGFNFVRGTTHEKYAWIKQYAEEFTVDVICQLMGVSRSADYQWLKRGPTAGEKDDAALSETIQSTFDLRYAPPQARLVRSEPNRQSSPYRPTDARGRVSA